MFHLLPREIARLLVWLGLMKSVFSIAVFVSFTLCAQLEAADPPVLRVGHFPNITHAQALVAHNLSRQGKGWFESRLGPGVKVEWFIYNAGPSAMEAIFAKSIELTYVGPGAGIECVRKIERKRNPPDCRRRQWRRSAGGAAGPKFKGAL